MWTREDLQKLIKEKMSDYLFVVVSNRQPYVNVFRKGKIEWQRGAGGVVTALDPVMRACNGLWVAYGSGEADRKASDEKGCLRVPPDNPSYTLKRVWLTKDEEKGYYLGYSNEALWPLCHTAFKRPVFRKQDWEHYKQVNRKFAKAVIEEVGKHKAFIFIQDYHLVMLAKYLKEMAPSQFIIAHFWHIPWPNYETFRICPQKYEILEDFLSNDLLGFHIRYHTYNFIDCIDREIECKIDRERLSIVKGKHETLIRPYPISVDFEEINKMAQTPQVEASMQVLKEEYPLKGMKVILGLDRIDYTKGIPERILAIDRLLDKYAKFKEKFVFIQMGVISRIHIQAYKDINDDINAIVEQVNWKHSTNNWQPIIMVRRHLSFPEVIAFYRIGDICVVSSLHDGMNLVAKEFISSRFDESGSLILSQFTGATRELGEEAIEVNPFDVDQFAEGFHKALTMPRREQKKHMSKMRANVQNSNIYRWSGKILSELLKFEFKE